MTTNTHQKEDVVVLGAGIQGTLIALLLAQRGRRVSLIDKSTAMLKASSLNYEGRIHTGMLYAMDRSFHTAERLASDALAFAPTIERLLGRPIAWEQLRSEPSRYFVHRNSHLGADQLIEFWTRLETKFIEDLRDDPTLSYVGLRPNRLFSETAIPLNAAPGIITRAFETVEYCLDQVKFNKIIEQAVLAHPLISVYLGHEVVAFENIEPSSCTFSARNPSGLVKQKSANLVVNCMWEARAIFDQAVGVIENTEESLRLKYSLLINNNDYFRNLGSFILTHGAYGGIVVTPKSETVMISWYPASIAGIVPVQRLSDDWLKYCAGDLPEQMINKILEENLRGFRSIFPDFPELELTLIKAGVIVADGLKDIDKTSSGFHQRNDYPIRRKGAYVSVSTGKYGSAPRNALILEQELFG